MLIFCLVVLFFVSFAQWYRISMIAIQILEIRKVLIIMSDSIASLELVKKLARAVVNAQKSEADAEASRAEALNALNDLKSQVTLDAEATELVAQALGNAVAAPPVDAEPIDADGNGVPDSEEQTDATDAVEQTPPSEGI